MTNREAYLDDLDELLKEIDQLLSAVPIGKTKLEHQSREQAEDVAGRAITSSLSDDRPPRRLRGQKG